jgi:hypothetical protein
MSNASNNNLIDGFDYSHNLIRYKGIAYPFRTIWVDREYHHAIISVSSLSYVIFDQQGCWPDSLAEYIDCKILYYVEDKDILRSDLQLQQILIDNLS